MTVDQLVKRTSRAQTINRIFQVGDRTYYVENSKGRICYRVDLDDQKQKCTCADFTKNITKSPAFKCKHIIAVLNCNGNANKARYLEKHRPRLDKEFITCFQGRDFVVYAGLLDLAHQKGILRITVDPHQLPTKENGFEAICKAEVESATGEKYVEWGDASPKNVNRKVAAHILRMAATRAKARALRDFTNIGMTCLEELGEAEEKKKTKSSNPVTPVSKKEPEKSNSRNEDCPTVAQLKAIENLSQKRGITSETLETMSQKEFGVSYSKITPSEAAIFIRTLQQTA